jgi:tetratricopeptide (TPR) repeat protein
MLVTSPGLSRETEEQPAPAPTEKQRVHDLLAEDRWREALEEAERLRAARPGTTESAALLGQALFRAGRFEEVDALLSPLAERPDLPPRALLTLARLRYAQGRGAESAALQQRALERAPEDRWLLYWAADVATSRVQTVELLQRYLELSEGDDEDRIEDARGTLNVLEELGQRKVWVPLERPESLELPLRHVWDETTGETIGYVVRAAAGEKGKAVRLLLDTGNHGLYVIHRLARKGGFAPLGEATTYGGGGERRHTVDRGLFPYFALGELKYGDALVTSTDEEIEATGRFHGLLGLSPFGGYRVTLDLGEKQLRLDWEAEPLDGEPYWVVSGQILVRARAAGGEPGLFLLDTGAMRSLISTAYAERLEGAVIRSAASVQGLGGMYEGARVVENVRLEYQERSGAARLIAVDTAVRSRMTGVEISGNLGLELLGGSQIVIDTRAQTIRISK